MDLQWRNFPLVLALTAAVVTPAIGQSERASALPDFSGIWAHANPGFEPLKSGPTSLVNLKRRPNGTGDILNLTGDHTNPILKPAAAAAVKKHAQYHANDKGDPNPRNQCWEEGPPFVFTNGPTRIIQSKDKVTILYQYHHQVRHVRMNAEHPAKVTPSWYGDFVGRYEGDTLVIDTVGIKVGKYSMVDWYGTPHTEALHVVERYRMLELRRSERGLRTRRQGAQRPRRQAGRERAGQVPAAPLHCRGPQRLHDAVERDDDVSECDGQRPRLGRKRLRRELQVVPGAGLRRAAGGKAGLLIGGRGRLSSPSHTRSKALRASPVPKACGIR